MFTVELEMLIPVTQGSPPMNYMAGVDHVERRSASRQGAAHNIYSMARARDQHDDLSVAHKRTSWDKHVDDGAKWI